MKKEKHHKVTGDFKTYPENCTRNSVGAYVAQKKLFKRIINNVTREEFERITGKKIVVDDFQDYSPPEKGYEKCYEVEVDDRLMNLTKDEIIEIHKAAPKHSDEWLIKTIFRRRIRKCQTR